MKNPKTKTGSAPGPGLCPFCGGALTLSGRKNPPCRTCGYCSGCGLVVTPDRDGPCGRCAFLLRAARPFGFGAGGVL